MVQRVQLTRKKPYNTRSNKKKIIRTPGGRLTVKYLTKRKSIVKCAVCKDKLRGITPARPATKARLPKKAKTVSRIFGGNRCHKCVKNTIKRAFYIEEHKIVKKLGSTLKKPAVVA
ncbi:60S ribosomal protein L34-like [Octopus sinensis]|uniref:Large ribosomal subunit protein eL34 n=1 Tax=Octopus sinensis TaxID=2607531 RepID=A0A6P7TWY9_9MOLL|nr:60S ribosomal protein L34-like [Octopus sinensis]